WLADAGLRSRADARACSRAGARVLRRRGRVGPDRWKHRGLARREHPRPHDRSARGNEASPDAGRRHGSSDRAGVRADPDRMAGRPHRRANLHSVAMTMTRPRVATEAPWRQRFHTTRLGFPSWARDHPDRIVYISNESGKFEVYTWDRRAGARRQLTDRPEGTGFRVPTRL